jgi:hypothetical protein
MPQGYHTTPAHDAGDGDDPRLAIRRHSDRCFHRVEERVPEGYIVQGILIANDDVAEVIPLDAAGAPLPACDPSIQNPKSKLKNPQ